jgi:hypothetical protein
LAGSGRGSGFGNFFLGFKLRTFEDVLVELKDE